MPVAPHHVRTDRGPFGFPRGLTGRVAGRLMAANDAQQQEVADLVELPAQGLLCEVGYGPGRLLRLLASRFPNASLFGADPSPVMFHQASRSTRAAPGGRPVGLRVAAVEELPFDVNAFDVTLSINNVQFWPDLAAGLDEIRRVTRPGGQVLVVWHGGSNPSRIQRRLILTEDQLAAIAEAIAAHIGRVERTQLNHSELFTAVVALEGAGR